MEIWNISYSLIVYNPASDKKFLVKMKFNFFFTIYHLWTRKADISIKWIFQILLHFVGAWFQNWNQGRMVSKLEI